MITTLDANTFETLIPSKNPSNDISYNLSSLRFVKPHGIIGFLLLLIYLKSTGRNVEIYPPVNSIVLEYLRNIGFFLEAGHLAHFIGLTKDYFSDDIHPTSTMQILTRVRSFQDVRPIADKLANYLLNDLKFEKALVNEMWSLMVEMIENIPHHAYPIFFQGPVKEGFINIQYLPNQKRLFLAMGDLGIGIKGSLELHGYHAYDFDSDAKMIKKVMESEIGLSSKGGIRGGGIYITAQKIKDFGGWMAIRSKTGYVIQNPVGKIIMHDGLKYLPGTQVSIHITRKDTSGC